MTDDLIVGHNRRYTSAAEGEQWILKSWSIARIKELLGDRSFGIGIDEVNLCHTALNAIGCYTALKYGETEGYRQAFPSATPISEFALCKQMGPARFYRAWDRMAPWLE